MATGALPLAPFRRSNFPPLPFLLRLSQGQRCISSAAADGEPVSPTCSSNASSPSKDLRRKPSSSNRLASVADAIKERKLPPQLRGRPNGIRSETDIENIVERRVWHSMEEGQFENLPGKGKPLNLNTNPHVDPAEDTLYRILSRNRCAPEWVELNKEIRDMIKKWRSAVKRTWTNQSNDESPKWTEQEDKLKAQMCTINSKVLHYNLIVPFGRQMCGLKWEKEIESLRSE